MLITPHSPPSLMRPRPEIAQVWKVQWEETVSQPDNEPLMLIPGDLVVQYKSGWMEKLTEQQLLERFEKVADA